MSDPIPYIATIKHFYSPPEGLNINIGSYPDLNLSYPSLSPEMSVFTVETQKIEIIMDRNSKGGVLVKETNQRNQQKQPK